MTPEDVVVLEHIRTHYCRSDSKKYCRRWVHSKYVWEKQTPRWK